MGKQFKRRGTKERGEKDGAQNEFHNIYYHETFTTMRLKNFKHHYDDCVSTDYDEKAQCEKCKTRKWTDSEWQNPKEKYIIKQRLMRRTKKLTEILAQLKTDMDLLRIGDEYSGDFDKMSEISVKFESIDLRDYKKPKNPC